MKSSTQVFASLVAALATLSQSAIATSSIYKSPQHLIDPAPVSNNSSPTPQNIALQPPSLVAQQSGICKKWQTPVTIDTAKSPAQSGDIDEGVNRTTRCISINKVSSNFDAKKSKPKTWLIIHGWLNNSYSPDIKELAEAVVKQNPGDRVLMLDWGQASMNRGNTKVFGQAEASLGVYYAATWIRPIAEVVVDKLKNEYKLTDREAYQSLNIIGHSLGTLMASEIGGVYKDRGGLPINSIIALDPASETSTNNPFIRNLGGYDVDGRTPAYVWNDFLYVFEKRDLRPEAIDRPRRFNQVSRFSRAFVGAKSLAGNQEFASWAHESFQMNFLNAFDLGGEHGRVVQAFTNIISQRPFKQPNSTDSFLDLDDLSAHNDCEAKKAGNFMRCDAVDGKHEGTVEVNSSNMPTSVKFTASSGGEQQIAATKPSNRSQDIQTNSGVKYQLCGDFPQWKRPTEKEQENKLRSYGRYNGVSIQNGYWKSDVVIFDDYGSSLLQDASIYAGLWKPLGGNLKCSIFNNEVSSIVSKKIAVGWIFNHKVEKIYWQNNTYVIQVYPSKTGVQFIKFSRVEKKDKISLVVITKNEKKILSCSVSGEC